MSAVFAMLDGTDALRLYKAGESAQKLAHEFKVNPTTFGRWLKARGVQVRSRSEAALLRDRTMPAESRQARAEASHAARRGRKNGPRMGLQRAATVEGLGRAATRDEAELAFWLARRGYTPVLQKAIGVYNVDLAFEEPRVAVELNGITHQVPFYADARADPAVRLKYLLNAGWNVLEIITHPARHRLRPVAAEHVIVFLDVASSNESARGEHFVVTGDGEVRPELSDQFHDWP